MYSNYIFFDSKNIFNNSSMLSDIKSINKPFIINGIGGKSLVVDKVGTAGRFGKTLYNPNARANILSYTSIIDMGYKINYSINNDEFIVRINSNKSYKFRRNGGYYIFNARHIFENNNNSTPLNNSTITIENNSNNNNVSINNTNQLDYPSTTNDIYSNNNDIRINHRGTTLSEDNQLFNTNSNQHIEKYDINIEQTQPEVINDQGAVAEVVTYLAAASRNICKVEDYKVQTKRIVPNNNQSSIFPPSNKTIKTVFNHPNHPTNKHFSSQSNKYPKKHVRFTKRIPPDINPRFKSSTLLTNQE